MLPKTIALVDDDDAYTELLAEHLRDFGVHVDIFGASDELLADSSLLGYDFYLVELALPSIGGLNLIKALRLRTDVGVLAVSTRPTYEMLSQVVAVGGDMYLAKPIRVDELTVAIKAVHRRTMPAPLDAPWQLDRKAHELVAPDGARIKFSKTDQTIVECFLEAAGEIVSRESLRLKLGRACDGNDEDKIDETIDRLHRRITRATKLPRPLVSKTRIGYILRLPLISV